MKRIVSFVLALALASFIGFLTVAPLQASDEMMPLKLNPEFLKYIEESGYSKDDLIELANELLEEAEKEGNPYIAEDLRFGAYMYLLAAGSPIPTRSESPAASETTSEASDEREVEQESALTIKTESGSSDYKLWEVKTSGGAAQMDEIAAQLNRSAADDWEVVAAHPPFDGWAIFTFAKTNERLEYKLWEVKTSGGAAQMDEIAVQLNRSAIDGWEVVAAHPPFNGWAIFTFAKTNERFEYKLWEVNTSRTSKEEIAAELNRSRAEGWEIAAVHPPFNGWAIFTFKRKL